MMFILVGYVWMLCVPMEEFGRATYCDENALGDNSVRVFFFFFLL